MLIALACKDSSSLNSGENVEDAIRLCDKSDLILAIGFNCCAPRLALPLLRKARKITKKPLVIYPNSGESWDGERHCWAGCGELKEQDVKSWIDELGSGGLILGGCCRVGPKQIAMIRDVVLRRKRSS